MTNRIELNNDQKEALADVRDLISDPENAFSIRSSRWWADGEEMPVPLDSHRGRCGTPACILGWSTVLSTKKGQDVCRVDTMLGCELFTPTVVDGRKVFSWVCSPEWFTRERTVAALNHLLKTGELDWLALDSK